MKFLFFCALLLVSTGVFSLIAVVIIGSSVDAAGVLHEPVALMDLCVTSLVSGLALGSVWAFLVFYRRVRPS
ncbi:MAG: hypothetical protein CMH69_17020 [Nitratireductor sp.]|uniref:DUF3955 domain-containing protein n=1 Tax=Nitratireductor sp. B36 TaxID=2762059 RepID=UPI000C9130B0|nr:DUF3955 domain-containing protein [Nitratireductor sp. B36]MAS14999.1 hypothetical protein [Nitratireductor sp.]MCC5779127.1 DUF3955 domain-containing protein [Nitratireductor sp. B36]